LSNKNGLEENEAESDCPPRRWAYRGEPSKIQLQKFHKFQSLQIEEICYLDSIDRPKYIYFDFAILNSAPCCLKFMLKIEGNDLLISEASHSHKLDLGYGLWVA
jgi:hypothetical protein